MSKECFPFWLFKTYPSRLVESPSKSRWTSTAVQIALSEQNHPGTDRSHWRRHQASQCRWTTRFRSQVGTVLDIEFLSNRRCLHMLIQTLACNWYGTPSWAFLFWIQHAESCISRNISLEDDVCKDSAWLREHQNCVHALPCWVHLLLFMHHKPLQICLPAGVIGQLLMRARPLSGKACRSEVKMCCFTPK